MCASFYVQLASQKLKDGGFDQSLFERLIISNYPCTELKRQYRMHPDLVPLYEYHYFKKKHIKEGILPGEVMIIIIAVLCTVYVCCFALNVTRKFSLSDPKWRAYSCLLYI